MKLIVKRHIIAQQRTVLGHYSGGEVEMDAKDDMVAVASKVDMTRRSKQCRCPSPRLRLPLPPLTPRMPSPWISWPYAVGWREEHHGSVGA